MYITLESDYAVRITAELCRTQDKLDAKTISERTNVTLRFSLKILRKLVAAGIVKSFKGTQGGYKIAREPSEITLKSVIEAIEIDKKCYIKLLCLLVVFIIVGIMIGYLPQSTLGIIVQNIMLIVISILAIYLTEYICKNNKIKEA